MNTPRQRRGAAVMLLPLLLMLGCSREPTAPQGGTPRMLWSVPLAGQWAAPAADDATVYFELRDHGIAAVDRTSGRLRWQSHTGIPGAFGTWGHDVVLAAGLAIIGDQDLFAFDTATGERRWVFQPANLDQPGFFGLASDATTVYAGTPEGRVYAVDALTGQQRWATQVRPVSEDADVYTPVLRGDRLFVCVRRLAEHPIRGGLAALSALSGQVLWFRPFTPMDARAGSGCVDRPAVHAGLVVAAVDDGRLLALDAVTGDSVWGVPRLFGFEPGKPLNDLRNVGAGEGIIVAGSSSGVVVGLDGATGAERWRAGSLASTIGPIIVADGVAYVAHSSDLTAYDLESGQIQWNSHWTYRTSAASRLWPAPLVDSERLFVSGPEGLFGFAR